MEEKDKLEIDKEFSKIIENSRIVKAEFILNIKKENLSYEELVELAGEAVFHEYFTRCVMRNIHALSKTKKSDKLPKNFADYIKFSVMTGMGLQKRSQAIKGGLAKSSKYLPLQMLAAQLVNSRKFQSRRSAAKTIMPEILNKAKELNIPLSVQQAEITITGWLKERGLPANK